MRRGWLGKECQGGALCGHTFKCLQLMTMGYMWRVCMLANNDLGGW